MVHRVHDNVPDLSISIRTGKETNMDFCSRGDERERAPVVIRKELCTGALEHYGKGGQWGDSPRAPEHGGVALFGSAV